VSRLSIFRDQELILEHELLGRQIALGRHPDNDIVLEDRTLSRFHARLESRGPDYVVVPLPNQNGVFVNGIRVSGEHDLAPGDRIRLGCYVAIYDPPRAARVGRGTRGGDPTRNEDVRDITASLNADDDDPDLDFDFDDEDASDTFGGSTGEVDDPFAAPSTAVERADKPRFVLTYNGVEVSRHDIDDGLIIGRSKTSDVVISLLGLSRRHAVVRKTEDGITVEDLSSQNGTWVNNARIEGARLLRHGDILNFYEYSVIFLEDESSLLELPDDGDGFDLGMPTGTEIDSLAARPTHARGVTGLGPKLTPPTKRTTLSELTRDPASRPEPSVESQLDALGLGDGSYLGEDFDEGEFGGGTDSDRDSEGTDLLQANIDFDDDSSDTFDTTTFSGRPPELQEILSESTAWPTDEALLSCLAASQREALISLEVFLDGNRYTQMPLSNEVTRIGSDARCDLALPPESGVAPWHCTLIHVGSSTICYRANRSAHLESGGDQFDAAVLEDGDELLLGRVRIVLRRR
jgi:pSer/pThr/pTyr-binding forkhead associated (FHA) protein